MKTETKTISQFKQQLTIFLKNIGLIILIIFLANGQAFAKGKKKKDKPAPPRVGMIAGFVVDEEFNEPLEKAVVTIPGTYISVLTDQ